MRKDAGLLGLKVKPSSMEESVTDHQEEIGEVAPTWNPSSKRRDSSALGSVQVKLISLGPPGTCNL